VHEAERMKDLMPERARHPSPAEFPVAVILRAERCIERAFIQHDQPEAVVIGPPSVPGKFFRRLFCNDHLDAEVFQVAAHALGQSVFNFLHPLMELLHGHVNKARYSMAPPTSRQNTRGGEMVNWSLPRVTRNVASVVHTMRVLPIRRR